MGFSSPILGGEDLIRSGMRSPNYLAGVAGWRIAQDGSAEFNNVVVRGTLATGVIQGPVRLDGDLTMGAGGRIYSNTAPPYVLIKAIPSQGLGDYPTIEFWWGSGGGSGLSGKIQGRGSGTGLILDANGGYVDVNTGPFQVSAGSARFKQSVQCDQGLLVLGDITVNNHISAGGYVYGASRAQGGAGAASAWIGPWPPSPTGYAIIGNRLITDTVHGSHYCILMPGGGDLNTYFGVCGNAAARAFLWRDFANGATWMTLGTTLYTLQATSTLCVAVPALGGGNTMNLQVNSSWQVGYVSSSLAHKQNVRTLRTTPERDAGPDNPIFRLRPVRFTWRHDPKGIDGVANGEMLNRRYPNGVVGLLAEEVYEVAPDAVLWSEGREAFDIDPATSGFLPENDVNGEPVLHYDAIAPRITGLDHDRLVAYLIDAAQHLDERIAALERVINEP